MGLKFKLGITLLLIMLVINPFSVSADTVTGISQQLVCQCGCGMVLGNCSHAECGSREALTIFIQQELDQGKSDPQIIQTMVAQYGEQVLAAPTKKGLNLTVWLLPFIALLVGGVVVYIVLKKWVKQGAKHQAEVVEAGDDKYRHRLSQELKDFTGGVFR